jgi:predicted nucleotidyltransferase
MLKEIIEQNRNQFLNLCHAHHIKSLFAFGSSVNGKFSETSDVDLVVDISESDPISKGELLVSLWDKLEKFFNRKVDLLTDNSIRNPFLRAEIEKTKTLVYDGAKDEILL